MKLINFFNIYSCLNESLPTEIAASSSDYSRKRITEKEREIEREREREGAHQSLVPGNTGIRTRTLQKVRREEKEKKIRSEREREKKIKKTGMTAKSERE
jgi:hypothetical protein